MAVGKLYLYVHNPDTVLSGLVNQASFTYPLGTVDVDNLTGGVIGDAKAGMTVVFGSAAGQSDKGRTRLRADGSSGTLFLARASQGNNPTGGADGGRDGEVDLADNLHFTVWDDRRVWPKVPAMLPQGDGVRIYKDGFTQVGDNTNEPPPVANGGAGFGDVIDSGTSVITVDLDSADSFAVADGATISSVLWDVDDGTITTGTTSSTAITATFPAGFRYVSLTVTDSNSNTHTTYIPVVAEDPDASILVDAFEVVSQEFDEHGQTLRVRIISELDAADYPDGTLVMLWEGEAASAADRSHMRFIGWHNHDPGDIAAGRTATLDNVILECVDVLGRLRRTAGFGQEVENVTAGNANRWYKMATANVDKYMHYLLHWHSTALEVAPFTWSGTGTDYDFIILGSDKADLFTQVNTLAQSMIPQYKFTCNSRGEMRVLVDPMIQAIADRTSTIQATIDASKWTAIRAMHTRPPRVGMLHGGAILATHTPETNAEGQEYPPTVFCASPNADNWGHGLGETRMENFLAPTQNDLNTVIGHMYARLNPLEDLFTIGLASDDWPGIEPADMTWINLTVPESLTTPRQRFGTARMLPRSVSIRYSHTSSATLRTVEVQAENETRGVPAETVFIVEPEAASLDLFVGVGFQDAVTSTDGDTWVSRTPAASNLWRDVAWSPDLELLAAVSSTGTRRVMTSPDGITWTIRDAADNGQAWVGVTWGDDKFVAVADSGAGNRIMTSSDGITWSGVAAPQANQWKDVAYSSSLGLFCAVAASGTNRVMTSPDGTNWTVRTHDGDVDWTYIIWVADLGLFVARASAASNCFMTSPDGITWTRRTTSTAGLDGDLAYSPSLGQIASPVGSDGGGGSNGVFLSSDGINWSVSNTLPATDEWVSIAWSPTAARYVVRTFDAGTERAAYSGNGTAWSSAGTPLTGESITRMIGA